MAAATDVVRGGFLKAVAVFFEYDTPKIVHIRSKKVGIINRVTQLVILGYIIGYAIVWEKGYQEFDDVESATTTKLKGVVYLNSTELNVTVPGVTDRLWDVADYVIPPQESDAFFVTTNVIRTAGQVQGICPEDPTMLDVNCTKDVHCPPNTPVINGNGVRTGSCNQTTHTCNIYAWCPVEYDELPLPGKSLFSKAKDFTVLIKNSIEFPKFKVRRRNILETQNKDYLRKCHYDSSDSLDRLCPIFYLGTMVHEAGQDFDTIAVEGGVIAINIEWQCNLDYSVDQCKPKYSFSRLDLQEAKIAKGWNFRYANYYDESGLMKRDLIKAYGLRFVIKVKGEAGKFSVVPLLLNLGSGLALLAIATVLCDIVVLYILKKGPFYQEKKYLNVVDDDAFQGIVENADPTPQDPLRSPLMSSYQATDSAPEGTVTNRRTGDKQPTVGKYDNLQEDE